MHSVSGSWKIGDSSIVTIYFTLNVVRMLYYFNFLRFKTRPNAFDHRNHTKFRISRIKLNRIKGTIFGTGVLNDIL